METSPWHVEPRDSIAYRLSLRSLLWMGHWARPLPQTGLEDNFKDFHSVAAAAVAAVRQLASAPLESLGSGVDLLSSQIARTRCCWGNRCKPTRKPARLWKGAGPLIDQQLPGACPRHGASPQWAPPTKVREAPLSCPLRSCTYCVQILLLVSCLGFRPACVSIAWLREGGLPDRDLQDRMKPCAA